MTEKLMITQEQADAIELYKANSGKGLGWMQYFVVSRHYFNGNYVSLKEFTVDEFAKLLYEPNSYEVKPSYKVGDWVITGRGMMGRFSRMEGQTYVFTMSAGNIGKSDNLRHATPEEIESEKERQLWKSIGREVSEFKNGDVGRTKHTKFYAYNETDKLKLEHHYKHGLLTGFYPVESFISFEEGEGE